MYIQEKILKYMLTLFFAMALLLAIEVITLSGGVKNQNDIQEEKLPHQKIRLNVN